MCGKQCPSGALKLWDLVQNCWKKILGTDEGDEL